MKKFAPLVVVIVAFAAMITPTAFAGKAENCAALDSGRITAPLGATFVTVTAPEGFLISDYCVKSGNVKSGGGAVNVNNEDAATVTIRYPGGKKIGHYSYSLVAIPVDLCPNLAGNQGTVPVGYELVDGQCVPIPPPDVLVAPTFSKTEPTCESGETVVVQDTEAIDYWVEEGFGTIVHAQAQPGYDLIATNEPGGWFYDPAGQVDHAIALATLAPALEGCPTPASCSWTLRTIPGYPDFEIKARATGLSTTEVSRLTLYKDDVSIHTHTALMAGRVGNLDGEDGVLLDNPEPAVYVATWTINTTGAVQATCTITVP